jgi:hypothetical protein
MLRPRSALVALSLLTVVACSRKAATEPAALDAGPSSATCDAARHAERAQELDAIWKADQADRSTLGVAPMTYDHDKERRARVKAIADEGCILDVHDLNVGWLVYQHGTNKDDHQLAVDFARRALALSDDADTRQHFALAADRWLVSDGKKQLFATQAQHPADSGRCACLVPVQADFPDDVRVKYGKKSLADQKKWVEGINGGRQCGPLTCDVTLEDVPRGTFAGVW